MERYDPELVNLDVRFETSCASGPGGQHVNRTRSRVTACLSIGACAAFTPEQIARLLQKLANRLTQDGVLRVSSEDSRSQEENKQTALKVMHDLLGAALLRPKKRVATKRSRASQQRRIDEKTQRGRIKRARGGRHGAED